MQRLGTYVNDKHRTSINRDLAFAALVLRTDTGGARLWFRLGFEESHEEVLMSASESSESFLERNWSWLVIAFGLILVVSIDIFAPTW